MSIERTSIFATATIVIITAGPSGVVEPPQSSSATLLSSLLPTSSFEGTITRHNPSSSLSIVVLPTQTASPIQSNLDTSPSSTSLAPPTSTPSPVQTHGSTGSAYKERINIGVVVGGAIGGVVVAIVLLTVCYRCRKRSVARHATNAVVGENLPPPAPSTERTPFFSISKAISKQGQIHRNLLQSLHIIRPSPNHDNPNAPDSTDVNQLSTAGPRMESTLRPLTPLRAGRTTEITEIRERIRLMQEQIESLQRQGPLAAANDPPPGYTSPRQTVVRADPPYLDNIEQPWK